MSAILELLWEATVQSAVLFLAIALLRRALRGRVSPRLQYALWGLMLLRLLAPVPLQSPFSILNAMDPANAVVREFARQPISAVPQAGAAVSTATPGSAFGWPEALAALWLAGAAATAACMIFVNVRFVRRAMREARPMRLTREHLRSLRLTGVAQRIPLYVSDGIPSPCLVGLVRPKVLLTPEAARMPDRLRHILLHELCHWRQRDNWIALLRNAACALHWFNPFVWAAAALSRRDCEMACDASALRLLQDGENLLYGETLVRLIRKQPGGNLLNAATTMAAGVKEMKERLNLIVRRPRTLVAATVGMALVAVALAAAACTGAVKDGKQSATTTQPSAPAVSQTPETAAPTAFPQPTPSIEATESAHPSTPDPTAQPDNIAPAETASAQTDNGNAVKLWEQGDWTYWLQSRENEKVTTKDGKTAPSHLVGRLFRTGGGSRQVIDEFVSIGGGAWTVHPAMDRIVYLGYMGDKYTELKGLPSIVSVNRDGTDKKVFAPKLNVARCLCIDGKHLYYEGWTNDGSFPRPVNRLNLDLTGSMKMADIQGWLITVKDGYAYYVGKKGMQVYRQRMDWKSKPEIYLDDFQIGVRFTVRQTGENEFLLTNDSSKTMTLEIK